MRSAAIFACSGVIFGASTPCIFAAASCIDASCSGDLAERP